MYKKQRTKPIKHRNEDYERINEKNQKHKLTTQDSIYQIKRKLILHVGFHKILVWGWDPDVVSLRIQIRTSLAASPI